MKFSEKMAPPAKSGFSIMKIVQGEDKGKDKKKTKGIQRIVETCQTSQKKK